MLSIVSDISKYTRANNHGDIIFSKSGLQAGKSVFKLTIIRSGFFLTIPSISSSVKLRFTCAAFVFEADVRDGANTNYNMSQISTLDNYGSFFIDAAGSIFDAELFMQFLRGSTMGKYYDLVYQEINGDEFAILFTAKIASADYNLAVTSSYLTPAAYTNDPTFYKQSLNAYSAASFTDYKLHIRILIEDADKRGVFNEVYTTYQTVGEIQPDGRTLFYFNNIPFVLRQYLSFNAVENVFRILLERDVYRKFKIEYWESWFVPGARTVSNAPKSFEVATKYVALSGIDERSLHCTDDIVLLNNSGTTQYLAPNQPAWFSFFISEEMTAGMEQLTFIVRDNLGQVTNVVDCNTLKDYSNIFHVPIFYKADTANLEWVEAELEYYGAPGGNPTLRSSKKRFYIDRKHQPIDKWYYYLNSLGGIDSIRLFGESEDTLAFTYGDYETIRKTGEYIDKGQMQRFAAFARHKTKAYSGWIDRELVDQFKDFMYSRFIYEVDTKKLPQTSSYNTFPMRYSLRHTTEQLISHKVLIQSKDLIIPKLIDPPSFQINIERTYNDRGILHSKTCSKLPLLQEDYIDIVFQFDTIYKGPLAVNVGGKMANLTVNANGSTDSIDGTPSTGFTGVYASGNATYLVNYINSQTAHFRIRANYAKDLTIIFYPPSGHNGKIYLHDSKMVELENITIQAANATTWNMYGTREFYLRHWTTLKTMNVSMLDADRALDLLLAVNNYRNVGSISGSFTTVDLTNGAFPSGISPVVNSPLARTISALATQSVNVIL